MVLTLFVLKRCVWTITAAPSTFVIYYLSRRAHEKLKTYIFTCRSEKSPITLKVIDIIDINQ